jgi:hypothetical protein
MAAHQNTYQAAAKTDPIGGHKTEALPQFPSDPTKNGYTDKQANFFHAFC